MAARVRDHADETVLGDVVVRTEGGATAVAADRDHAFLGDAVTRLRDGIARDREVTAARKEIQSTEADRVAGRPGGVTHHVDGLGRDAADAVEGDGHGDAVTRTGDGAVQADPAGRGAQRRGIPLDVGPEIADAVTVRGGASEGDVALRTRDAVEQHDGDAVDARVDDGTDGHPTVAGEGIALVDDDRVRRGGERGQVGGGDEAADRRDAGRGRAVSIVERDDARYADETRIERRAAGEHVVVDARGRTRRDGGVRRSDRRGLVTRRDVVGDRAAVAAGVGDHRDGAGLVDVVVRTERHAAAVGVGRDVAVGVDAVADLVEAVTGDDDVAEDARGGLARGEGEDRHRALADGIIAAGKGARAGEGDALGRQQAGEVHGVPRRGDAEDVDGPQARAHRGGSRDRRAAEGDAAQDDAGGAAEGIIDRDPAGARDQSGREGGGIQVTADRSGAGRRRAIGVIEGDDPGDGDHAGVDRRAGGILVEVDVRGRTRRDGQVAIDDGRSLATRGDVIGHRAGLAARIGDHRDVAGVVDVIVRLEQHVAAVGVDGDAAVGRDPLPRLIRVVTRDGKPRAAGDDGHRAAQDDARGGGVGLAQDGDRLGAHRAGVIKAVQRVGRRRDVDPPRVGRQHGGGVADEARTGVAQTPDRDIARRRGHGGAGVDAVVAGAGDATQDDALATGQGIIQGDAIGRSGQGAPIGRGDVTAGRRAGDAGRATPGVVERDDAGDGDRARIEVSARSIDVVIDTGRGAGRDRQVARHEARGLVARREVIGDEAVAAARVLGQRDRAVLADVVVRFEQDAAAVRVIRDRASLIDAAGELVAVIPRDEQVAAPGHDGQRAKIDGAARGRGIRRIIGTGDGDVLRRDQA